MTDHKIRPTFNPEGRFEMRKRNVCAAEGCSRFTVIKQMGFCSSSCRFWAGVTESNGGHWEWTGKKTKPGYGHVSIDGKRWLTHRYAYTQLVADIPPDWDIDHLCKNRSCCNPDHLEALPKPEHHKRNDYGGYNRIKTHCKKGHPYDDENTLIVPPSDRRPNGGRQCRACIKMRQNDPVAKRAYDQTRKARNNELKRLRNQRKQVAS